MVRLLRPQRRPHPAQPNLLNWHRQLHFIDHGAALYFHHNWPDAPRLAASPYTDVRHHILLPWASALEEAAAHAATVLNPGVITAILDQVPNDWLLARAPEQTASAMRSAYLETLTTRLASSPIFTKEAIHARAQLV